MVSKRRDRFRLIAGALAPLVAAAICQAVYTACSQRDAAVVGMESKASAVAHMLVEVVGPSVALDDTPAVVEQLGYIAADPDFDLALVVDPQGKPIAYSGPAAEQAELEATARSIGPLEERDDRIYASAPIVTRGASIGTVVVGMHTDRVAGQVRETALIAALFSAFGVGIAIFVVLSLEGRVRNAKMSALLEHVAQGFLSVNDAGELLAERSAVAKRLLGEYRPGQTLWQAIEPFDPDAAAWIEACWSSACARVLPLAVVFAQMPKHLTIGGRIYRLEITPTRPEDLSNVLVVLTDITDERARANAEQIERDLFRMIERLASDRAHFHDFFSDTHMLIQQIEAQSSASPELLRDLHTLKGNSSVFGVAQIADLCHAAETRIAELGFDGAAAAISEVVAAWRAIEARFERLLASDTVGRRDLDALVAAIRRGVPNHELQDMIASWQLERVDVRYRRFAEQITGIARRAGKDPVDVEIDVDGTKLATEVWKPWWRTFSHLLRNVVDHGFEDANERRAASKPACRRVALRAHTHTDRFEIVVEDDGRGIDWDRVKSRAESLGLPVRDQEDLVAALFSDGFSTRSEISELSGRGVGLAAVRAACTQLGGQIHVSSKPGEGARFQFTFAGHHRAARDSKRDLMSA